MHRHFNTILGLSAAHTPYIVFSRLFWRIFRWKPIDGKHRDQDLVRDGHGGAQRAPPSLQPVVVVLVVAALLASRADGSLNQRRLEVDISFAGLGVLLFPGALVIAGADPGPCSQAL